MKFLITGGAGFIGSHLINYMICNTEHEIYCVDKLSYASKGWNRLEQMGISTSSRLHLYEYDFIDPMTDDMKNSLRDCEIIIHMGAETHVDKSIIDPVGTIHNNIMSTVNILEFARTLPNLKKFQYFSTDEVYGPAPNDISYKEWDRHNPTNPYSASKSSSENICLAYQNTYKLPIIITNLMNAFGIMQHVEKFIPLIIKRVLYGEKIYIHTCPNGIPGSRFYIHTSNIIRAVLFILEKGVPGEKYNIKGQAEVTNLELAQKIASIMGKPLNYELVPTTINRPGHDNRYALDGTKLIDMGFVLDTNFDELLEDVVNWTLHHLEWIQE